jgi:peroxiredoxin Q/BCP
MEFKTLALGAIAAATAMMGSQGVWKAGDRAPDFTAIDTNGKSHTLTSLLAQGDVFLYFISDTCPINAQAVKYFNRLSAAYKGKAQIIGVINTDKKGYAAWQKTFKAPFPVLLDPKLKVIRSYKANASPWMVQVKDKKIARVWAGYSGPYLKEINEAMATAGDAAVAKVDFGGAPADYQFG